MKAAQERELRDGTLPDGLVEDKRNDVRLLGMQDGGTYVPEALRKRLLRQVRENEAHAAAKTMAKKLREAGLKWDTMDADATLHEKACDACQRFAAGDTPARHASLGTRGEARPRQWLVADHAGPYALANGDRLVLLVMVDHATRYSVLRVVPNATAKTTWQTLLAAWFTVHGPPRKLLTDRSSAFDNAVVAKGCEDLGVEQVFGVRPEDQARAERLNAEIGKALRRMNVKSADAAVEAVAQANWNLNTRLNRSIGMTPFVALGVAPRTDLQSLMGDAALGPIVGRDMAELVETAELIVRLRSEAAFRRTKAAYDASATEWTPAANLGVLVWSPPKDRKLAPHWKGPMRVVGMHNERVARLWDPTGGREIQRHVSHLK
jgi:transposase InsO family protein